MSVKLLTEHHLEFLSLTGGCTGSSESTLVKMPHCWKSHVVAQMILMIMMVCLFAVPIQGPHGQDLALHPIHHTPVDLEVALHQVQGKI